MLPKVTTLLPPPTAEGEEQFFPLLQSDALRLEQIISHGQASPAGFWYDQPTPEWVALLRGTASLEFADGSLALTAGDALLIPAQCRHRVAACSADAIWLALHFQP
ncbi:phosphoribosylaminoimidazole carboxylase [Pseudomonas alcaligenes]|uniref:Phosphoribosylaminoimidazole carboxylase n=1 Tax=Aquipseudomonas alcaligenes TaxID=43263 RepID=A0ABR7S0K0_AQUAC|nr:cupin domain-containing protein [Pseudomonas alcaligenes]MBC9250335.1 phosphoribosylaminoimidazole carboxylase [Pseudomonas alcaligenes]